MGYSPIKAIVLALAVCTAVPLLPAAAFAEKPMHPLGFNHAGVHALKRLDPNLAGAGVRIGAICRSITYVAGQPQNDYRPNTSHNCLKNKRFVFHDDSASDAGISPHSTAICSLLFGLDPDAFNPDLGSFHYLGVAPDAEAEVYEFWHFLFNYVLPGMPPDADIITASMGSQFEDWWTRGIDSLVEQYGLVVVAGIGNGLDAYDPPLYPGGSANVIGVGVVDSVNTEKLPIALANFALAYPEHSSYGPTAAGLCKPDIVAPGNYLAPDANDANSYKPTGNWSSFSTPVVAGAIGLLVQRARQEPNLSPVLSVNGGNCAIKAILMNSATKLSFWHKGRLSKDDDHYVPLDYIQGAGMLNARRAYEQLVAGARKPGDVPKTGWDLNNLRAAVKPQSAYKIQITGPAGKTITATVACNQHYSSIYPFDIAPEKNANLRLEVWAVDPNNSENDYLLDYSDSPIDNVEHVYCRTDANYTDYEIVVSYSNPDDGNNPPERYGLAWNVSETKDDDSIFLYDLNADGIVDDLDFILFVDNLAASAEEAETCYLMGDIDCDGALDPDDLGLLFKNQGRKADWRR